ncbi:MAG: aminoacyl-tRNA hydrolase [Verrucomicrobia bacterium RIFCSPLOWO2_12_FULL_64_8]|nr:MAG: aminoacyl-tRNA hydrolase [Verrucomicrobia bacterium RIFCSPLOWO2_12_FULL_64_8]
MSVSIVAGLGNPGRAYAKTRHNAGFAVIDAFAARHDLAWRKQSRFSAQIARWERAPGVTWLLAKPTTFMNDSGRALRALADFHRVRGSALIVIYDDLAIELGRVKVSQRGSAGGHNGVASLLEHLGGGFARYRIGIGPKHPPEMDLKDFVLGRFTPDEQTIFNQNLSTYADGLTLLIDRGPAEAMNQLNRRN